ncbi:MAG TPA: acetate--CoA ligase family protein, partial [Acidimicrobiales bacterium]|nr:acetate--CoA ligase family protein [Acidimicrobiales bacterium]
MALCGPGCMGFLNAARGVRAIGYVEPYPTPDGPIALVTHSGSAFSALLRTRRQLGFTLAVSSGQEIVTTTAEYLEYALALEQTRVVALLLETVRDVPRLRAALELAEQRDVPVVMLTVGATSAGGRLVTAHSGALAGSDAAFEALAERHNLIRVGDLEELAETVELLSAGRRAAATGPTGGIATVHDSGAERALAADVASRLSVPFARIGAGTTATVAAMLDPGLSAENPLDLWGTGADTRRLFTDALIAFAADEEVAAVALCVDLVHELDGDTSYEDAALAAARSTDKPVAVLSNLSSAVDCEAASRLRRAGVPVLEGTRSGLGALGALLRHRDGRVFREHRGSTGDQPADGARRNRWLETLSAGRLDATATFRLLADYGISSAPAHAAASRDEVLAAARALGYPLVLKTNDPAVAHKSEVGGVLSDLRTEAELLVAYLDLAARLGPEVLVASMCPAGVDVAVGITTDPLVGPLVVVGAGGTLVEVIGERAVAFPPLDDMSAARLLSRLPSLSTLLAGVRGAPAVAPGVVAAAVAAVSTMALELCIDGAGGLLELDVNPLRCRPGQALALDALVVRDVPPGTQKIT